MLGTTTAKICFAGRQGVQGLHGRGGRPPAGHQPTSTAANYSNISYFGGGDDGTGKHFVGKGHTGVGARSDGKLDGGGGGGDCLSDSDGSEDGIGNVIGNGTIFL